MNKIVPSGSNTSRNTSLTAGNSPKETTGNQQSWRNKPRVRAPWSNPDIVTVGNVTYIHVVEPMHGVDKTVLVDEDDLPKLSLPIRIQNEYAFNCGVNNPVAHRVLGTRPDPSCKVVVDHINGNHLDNRKCNLRIISQKDNTRNKKHYSLNNTGIIGLSKGKFRVRKSPVFYDRYVATVTDPKSQVDPKTGKGKRYTRGVSFGIHRTEAEAREIALNWLREKQKELGYDDYPEIEAQRLSLARE